MAEKKILWRRVRRQFFAAAIANLAALCGGCVVTWTSPTLPRLAEQTSLQLTTSQKSWVGSMQALASTLGPAPAMVLTRLYGCRFTFFVTAATYLCGWVLVAAMRSVALLLVGRFVLGLALGSSFAAVLVYTGEISQVQVRGILGSFFLLFLTSGFLMEYAIGPYVSYLTLALVSGAIPLVMLVGIFFIPDSPYQLLARGRPEEARAAIMWLRNASSDEVSSELEVIKVQLKERMEEKERNTFKALVTKRRNIKALLLCLALGLFQQMCGPTAIASYTQTIFQASGANINASLSAIVNGVFMVLAGVASCILVDFVGRRVLILTSSAGLGLSMLSLGTYFYFKQSGNVSQFGWLPITGCIGFTIFYGTGWGPVPLTVASEVFPSEVKEKAMFLAMCFLNFVSFFYARFFLDISEAVGMHWCFWAFGACSLSAGLFSFFCLPETKGRSYEEIRKIFHA